MVSQELLDYIKDQLSKGIPKETIQTDLIAHNWTIEDVQSCFDQINNPNVRQKGQNATLSPLLKLNKLAIISLALSLLNIIYIFYIFLFSSLFTNQPMMIFIIWGQFLISALGIYSSILVFRHKIFGATLLKVWAILQIPIVQLQMTNSVFQISFKQFLDLTFYIGVFSETTKVSIGINFVGIILLGFFSRIKKREA